MLKKIEVMANSLLMRSPKIKKKIKRTYQLLMYIISKKLKYEGDLKRVSPNDGFEYFFGYYDKSPWDVSDRYMLCLRVKNTYNSVAPKDPAEILLFDTSEGNSYIVLGKTNAWNVQQGCMLQWLGPEYKDDIIYNDFIDGEYCSVILNINTGQKKVLPMPIYTVSSDGEFALTVDFERLHQLRKGYGYANKSNQAIQGNCPDEPCIWYLNLQNGETKPVLKYTDLERFEPRSEMMGAIHKVNHLMLSPSSNRFMVLHRWIKNNRTYSRLITLNVDGSEMYNLSDDDMVSHCFWKNDSEILGFGRKKGSGDGYYLMKDKTSNYQLLWPSLNTDGHPSYSPDESLVVTDTYPNRSRVSTLYCIKDNRIFNIAKVFSPFRYDNEVRCDLHPRWNRGSNKVCIDSTFEGKRALYIIDLSKLREDV